MNEMVRVVLALLLQGGGPSSSSPEPAGWPKGFGYIVGAYAVIWLVLMAYVWLLVRRTRRLSDRLDALNQPEGVRPAGR